jgi:hypothetical protein
MSDTCNFLYTNGTKKGQHCNEPVESNYDRCEFHNHLIFKLKNPDEILRHGLGLDCNENIKAIADWIKSHPNNFYEYEYYFDHCYDDCEFIFQYLSLTDCFCPYKNAEYGREI